MTSVEWDRLKVAMGTTSSDLVNATLAQIQNASRLPGGEISETSVKAVLAFIEGAEPKERTSMSMRERGRSSGMSCNPNERKIAYD
jgi:antitoxin component of RelBE/YafQ-DinJ toxin-antitoxin module